MSFPNSHDIQRPVRSRFLLRSMLLTAFLRRRPRSPQQEGTLGATLIECVVALAVLMATLTLITPPLFVATATRAQNRRAEQAMQIAQGEVDRIRALVAQDDHTVTALPKAIGVYTEAQMSQFKGYAAPASIAGTRVSSTGSCSNTRADWVAANQLMGVNIDGECGPEFYVQTYRSTGSFTTNELSQDASLQRPSSFLLGVRVYAALPGLQVGSLENQPASLQFTSGLGNQLTRPLATLYLPIYWSDQDASVCDYKRDTDLSACTGVYEDP